MTNEHPLQSRATLAERRKIGAYYTPQTVTDILSEWAIRSARDIVLEPGFGGCGFLESSANRLRALGCTEPSAHLHGCDIDDHAFHVLYTRLGLTQLSGHFVLGDFLSLPCEAFEAKAFDVAIGNPPYIRHHHIVGEQKMLVRALRDRMLPSLNLQASLWAYFVLHACEFLKVGGRAAWILPSSFAHAYYAKALRAFMHANFAKVMVIALDERLFEAEGAAESTVVIVVEGWKQAPANYGVAAEIVRAHSVDELHALLSGTACAKHSARGSQSVFENLLAKARPLHDFCKLSIGVVTGDATFFLFDREKADAQDLRESDLSPIVSRAKLVPGLSVSAKHLRAAFEKGAPSMILDTRGRQSAAMKRYLKSMSKKRIKANLTFGKRSVWHRPLDDAKSHAFFVCMSHYGPRLILNQAKGATCTNTLYRAAFYAGVTATGRRALSLALISSFGQLSAEHHGRRYGAGMLKHEPSEAEAIRLVVPTAARAREAIGAFKRVDALLRAGDDAAARLEADRFLVSTGAMSESQCRAIRTALKRARLPVAAQSQEMTDHKALKKALVAELAKDQPNLNRFAELSERLLVSDPDAVRFSVDAGHIKRLGQELVGKAETALAELIKNAYDADATTCTVTFENAEEKKGGTLIVEDDGTGMAEEDIRKSWMRLSTGTKLEHPLSALYQRSRAGRKGIGRFAVQRLATKLLLETRPSGEKTGYRVTFDWEGDYPQGASLSQVSNRLEKFSKQADEQGTKLVIKNLRDPWDNQAVERVWRSVLLLQPPFPIHRSRKVSGADADPGFSVTINGMSDATSKREWSIEKRFLDYAVAVISGKIDAKGVATFTLDSKRLRVKETHQPTQHFLALGELELKAHYFVYDARVVPGLVVKQITDFARMYGGVRVYRNGFRVPPYGEPNDDWLKLAFDTARRTLLIPANNFNFFGQVILNIERNALLEETSGREGLIENEAFAELQAFVRMGLEWGAKRVASLRERKVDPGKTRKPKDAETGRPSAALTSVISAVSSMAADSGDVRTAELVEELERVKEAQQVFEEAVEAERERAVRYEEMLRILASLGMSIAVFGHEIGGALTIVGAEIARLKQEAQTAKAEGLHFAPTENAVARLADLGRYIVDVMSNAESRELVSVPLHAAITRFIDQFSTYLDKQGVSFEKSVEPQYLRTAPIHRSEIDAVLFNFMTNALKAIRSANVAKGRIRVSAARRGNLAVLSFQDNGTGIPEDLHDRIFDAFYTTTDYAPDEVAGPVRDLA